MYVFSKLSATFTKSVGRLSAIAAKTKAKVGRRLPRGSTVLSGVKIAATVAGKVGSSVPYMQGIVDAANEVVACAESMKDNHKECKKIAALTEELVNGLLVETEGVGEDDLSERARLNLAELEWKLETIGRAMNKMRKITLGRGNPCKTRISARTGANLPFVVTRATAVLELDATVAEEVEHSLFLQI